MMYFKLAKTWKAYSKMEAEPKGVGHHHNNDQIHWIRTGG